MGWSRSAPPAWARLQEHRPRAEFSRDHALLRRPAWWQPHPVTPSLSHSHPQCRCVRGLLLFVILQLLALLGPASWAAWCPLPASAPWERGRDERAELRPLGRRKAVPPRAPAYAPVAPVGLLQAVVVGDVNFVNLPGALVVGRSFHLIR